MGDAVEETTPIDGRRARRERGRLAVIDAMLSLLQDGKVPVSADMVADRAGVSVASVFRYFDGLDDLQVQTFERFRERFEPLLVVPAGATRAIASPPSSAPVWICTNRPAPSWQSAGCERSNTSRWSQPRPRCGRCSPRQVRSAFAPDVAQVHAGTDLVAVIDALTSLESWDVMRKTHARTRRQIDTAWRRGIAAMITAQLDDGGNR